MLTVFSRNRERICWYVVNGSRALEVPAVYGRIFYIISENILTQPTFAFYKEGCSFFATSQTLKDT